MGYNHNHYMTVATIIVEYLKISQTSQAYHYHWSPDCCGVSWHHWLCPVEFAIIRRIIKIRWIRVSASGSVNTMRRDVHNTTRSVAHWHPVRLGHWHPRDGISAVRGNIRCHHCLEFLVNNCWFEEKT